MIGLMLVAASALAAGNYAFSPPVGWTLVHSGTTSKWANPARTETLTLFPTEFGGDLNAFVTYTLKRERTANPTQQVWTNRNYPICGGHTARYLIWTSATGGRNLVSEQVLTLWGYDGYIVTYVRPAKGAPSNVARASMLSICGVGSIPQAPGGVPVTPQNNAPPPAQPGSAGGSPPESGQPTPGPTGTIYHPYMPVIPNG